MIVYMSFDMDKLAAARDIQIVPLHTLKASAHADLTPSTCLSQDSFNLFTGQHSLLLSPFPFDKEKLTLKTMAIRSSFQTLLLLLLSFCLRSNGSASVHFQNDAGVDLNVYWRDGANGA